MFEKKGRNMIFGMVLAGGIGSRMASKDKPKQFLMLDDKPVIIHTIEKFFLYSDFEKIIVLCPNEWTEYTKDLLKNYLNSGNYNDMVILSGGATRNETIMNGIEYIENGYGIDDDTIIVTHDAARPFINERIIKENIEYTRKSGAATTAVPATDTILAADNYRFINDIPDRNHMYMCQTPQTFYAKQLKEMYESLSEKEKDSLTDASKILLLNGQKIAIVEGERYNIKLTYPEDMIIAEALLRSGII